MQESNDPTVDDLQAAVMGFVRSFGLHRPQETPCGRPVAISEAYALHELAGGRLAQQELARRLMLQKSTVSRLVAGLVSKGWLHQAPDPGDRRAMQLTLTAAGEKAAGELAEARRAKYTALLAAVPASQRAAVVESLTLLQEALNDRPPPDVNG